MVVTRRALGRTRMLVVAVGIATLATGCIYVPGAAEHRTMSPTTRPWWCDSSGDGGSHEGHGEHDGGAYDGMTKGMLSWDDCNAVSLQFDVALKNAQMSPTAGQAVANGYTRVVQYVGGMGTHHVRGGSIAPLLNDPSFDPHDPVFPGSVIDGVFEATRPEFLMYGGNSSSSKLVGMAWFVKTDNGLPPAGFAGDNDWWHVHPSLCFSRSSGEVIAEGITDAQCSSANGVNVHLHDYWMLHAWIEPDWQHHPDVFINHHPCLLPGGPAPPTDLCWEAATGHAGH